jgi:hypothetical protein
LEQAKLLTCSETPLADVSSQTLELPEVKLKLQAYAPMYTMLINPPYKFIPVPIPEEALNALQLEHSELLT